MKEVKKEGYYFEVLRRNIELSSTSVRALEQEILYVENRKIDQLIQILENIDTYKLAEFQDINYDSDVTFKNDIKAAIGNQVYALNEGAILEAAIDMNATLVLIGILGFIACFAFSLGPVMWVMLSEIFPNRYRGLAIGVIGFINSFSSWLIQQIFPWEISNLGSALTFFIYGLIATLGVLLFIKILPETKGKSLEQLENELVKSNV